MVVRFGLLRTPKIRFGAGEISAIPGIIKKPVNNVLIITGSKSFYGNSHIALLLSALESEKITMHFERIDKEPSPEIIDHIVHKYRDIELEAVIAAGGGSALDAGKAVSAMLPLGMPVKDYLEGVGSKIHPGVKKYFIAIPTTSGTGSEITSNAVLSGSDPRGGFKRSLRHENLVPDLAVIDPELTLGCPRNITAASGMDAFTQLMESYLSVKSGPLTDALAMEGIRSVHLHLEEACRHGENLEARKGMSYAAMLSGITLANAGLGLIHGFASSVGGAFDIPHGIICATLMATVNRYNIQTLSGRGSDDLTKEKYIRLGRLFSDTEGKEDKWYLQFTANYLDELTDKLNIPRLGTFGMAPEHLERVVSVTDHKANPVHFEHQQLLEILHERL